MNKEKLTEKIEASFQDLFSYQKELSDEKWMSGPENRWTVGQHYLHLLKSAEMLNNALNYPGFLLQSKFGTSNRPSKSYDEIDKNYHEKLSQNKEKAKEFNKGLREVLVKDRRDILQDLEIEYRKLEFSVNKRSESKLDKLLLPHPILGKMSLREIMMWTVCHTNHHLKTLKEDY